MTRYEIETIVVGVLNRNKQSGDLKVREKEALAKWIVKELIANGVVTPKE